jgi:hypothetical protein
MNNRDIVIQHLKDITVQVENSKDPELLPFLGLLHAVTGAMLAKSEAILLVGMAPVIEKLRDDIIRKKKSLEDAESDEDFFDKHEIIG